MGANDSRRKPVKSSLPSAAWLRVNCCTTSRAGAAASGNSSDRATTTRRARRPQHAAGFAIRGAFTARDACPARPKRPGLFQDQQPPERHRAGSGVAAKVSAAANIASTPQEARGKDEADEAGQAAGRRRCGTRPAKTRPTTPMASNSGGPGGVDQRRPPNAATPQRSPPSPTTTPRARTTSGATAASGEPAGAGLTVARTSAIPSRCMRFCKPY